MLGFHARNPHGVALGRSKIGLLCRSRSFVKAIDGKGKENTVKQ
jgi:hypothetical protein